LNVKLIKHFGVTNVKGSKININSNVAHMF